MVSLLPRTMHMVSLGCPKNLVDSEVMLGQLGQMGIAMVARPEDAELIMVNTCGFIEPARKEAVDAILQAAQYKQKGVCRALVVAGCLVQGHRRSLAGLLPEVDAFVGPDHCGRIGGVISRVWQGAAQGKVKNMVLAGKRPRYLYNDQTPRLLLTPRHYAYVKICDGCDNSCRFCSIPHLRGPFRSRPMESIVREVRQLVRHGVKEVILVGQDTTRYGVDLYGQGRLAALLGAVHEVEGLGWIRLMYAYPSHLTEEVIDAVARLPKVCKYIDMPIQHASDKILTAMGRDFTVAQTRGLIALLREKIPGVAIRTSLIVGLPGETPQDFERLLAEVRLLRFERLGVFEYSREEGTAAHHMKGQVCKAVKKSRRAKIMACQQQISSAFNQRWVGRTLDVLIDEPMTGRRGMFRGRTRWDAPSIDNAVLVRGGDDIQPGDCVPVRITKARAYDLEGMIAPPV